MVTNCINCGAAIEKGKDKCPYCDTPYDLNGFCSEINDFTGTITVQGKVYSVYLAEVEVNNIAPSGYRGADGFLHKDLSSKKRKFTLIEI